MGLEIGLVGLPNVGKSTTFNALTKAQNAESANYPFCTIEPNKAVVPLMDKRLNELAKIVNPEKIQYSTVDFVDIAGLVKGASKGEGLGNKFLSNIRESKVLLHVIRCFNDDNIIHTEGSVDPIRDIEIIEQELLFSDISTLQKKIDNLKKKLKNSSDKNIKKEIKIGTELLEFIGNGNMVITFTKRDDDTFIELNKDINLLTNKEIIYGLNVDEDGLQKDNNFTKLAKEYAKKYNRDVIKICAKIEEEMIDFDNEEREDMLKSMGVEESGLNQIIKIGFNKLGLISYFTAGVKEVRAWTVKKDSTAPKAAAVIHNDFEKGFIKAEVISFDDYIEFNGELGAKKEGKNRIEGKEYIVQDGDVIHFRFNN